MHLLYQDTALTPLAFVPATVHVHATMSGDDFFIDSYMNMSQTPKWGELPQGNLFMRAEQAPFRKDFDKIYQV
jgi:hypothetical protein